MDGVVAARRTLVAARWLLGFAGLVAMGIPTVIGIIRLRYPYELEWLETGIVEHVRRVAHGQALYTAPSVDFVEFPYPPIFMLVAGAIGAFAGVDYWTGRLISIAATVAIFALLIRMVRRETGQLWAGLFAGGVYGASYGYIGGFFDVGKADSLFLALTLWGVDRARTADTNRQAALAGLIFAIAILTKQTAVLVALPVGVYWLITRWRHGLAYGAVIVVVVGGVSAAMHLLTHGWFTYFVWELLLEHREVTEQRSNFFRYDLLPFWPALVAVVLVGQIWARPSHRWAMGLYGAALVGLMAGAFASRLHDGGFVNVLMPAVAGVALFIGLAAGWLLRHETWRSAIPVFALCGLQLFFLRFDMTDQLPSAADRRAGDAFITAVREIPGPVLIAAHPTYAVLAGKEPSASQGGVFDILRGTDQRAQNSLLASYASAIHERKYAAIMLDSPVDANVFPADWQSFYCPGDNRIFPDPDVFRSVTSRTGHPILLYVPCNVS